MGCDDPDDNWRSRPTLREVYADAAAGSPGRRCDAETTPESLVRFADEQLYRAKASASNRVCIGLETSALLH